MYNHLQPLPVRLDSSLPPFFRLVSSFPQLICLGVLLSSPFPTYPSLPLFRLQLPISNTTYLSCHYPLLITELSLKSPLPVSLYQPQLPTFFPIIPILANRFSQLHQYQPPDLSTTLLLLILKSHATDTIFKDTHILSSLQ